MHTLSDTPEEFKDQLHILIIDDDEVDQMSIRRSLSKTNLATKVYTASTAQEGLSILQEQEFDCIFLDFMLPDMNGLDLLEKINFMGVQAPILVVTSQGDEQIAAKAIQRGASDYIPKSFMTPDGVYHSVRNAIRLRKAEERQKQTAEHLAATQTQLRLLLSNLPVGIWNVNSQGYITFISGKILEMIGLKPASMVGQHVTEAYAGLPRVIERMRRALAGETVQAADEIAGCYLRSINVPVLNENGEVMGVNGFAFDITESTLNERALTEAKELAEQSVQVKEQFIANISHEIRTPMNGIIGLTNVLQKTDLNDDQLKFLKAIQTSADNLMMIINDLLDFSKMTSQNFTIEQVSFNVHELANELVLLMQERVKERNNTLSLELDSKIPRHLLGDPLRIRQILLNLIGNAAKFTEKGKINLSVTLKENREQDVLLEFTVQDNGIGIPEEKLESIFESFNQGSNDTTRKYGGTGLGLTISKSLVELQGGNIVVRSKPMAGSTFSFALPFSKVQPTETVAPEYSDEAPEQEQGILPLNILLAEDNEINQLLINKVLSDWGIQTTIVENGKLALEKLETESYDLVLMDMQMPVMDGYEAIREIRQLDNAKAKIPIISLTAHAAASEIEKCLAAGADAYVSKPFDPKVLYAEIQRLTAAS